MTRGVRTIWLLACGLAVLAVVVAVLWGRGEQRDGRGWSEHRGAQSGRQWFTVSGDVSLPLTPGVGAAIDLEFANRHWATLSVSDIKMQIEAVKAPNASGAHPCTVADFGLEQVPQDTRIRVPAGETRSLSQLGLARRTWPRLVLVDRQVNQDGCKGASLVLAYSASGAIGR